MIVTMLGAGHTALQWWGDLAWFRLELPGPPIVWWAMPSSVFFWLLGAGVLWGLIVSLMTSNPREGDRRKWIWRGGGLAIVTAVCIAGSYSASRNGMALYEDRILYRAAIYAPMEAVTDEEVSGLVVSCEMVRRGRSFRADDLIDRPTFWLVLRDSRRLRIGGVRGGGIGERSQADWLSAMRLFSRYSRAPESVSESCVDRVVARFPDGDQPFVRTLFERRINDAPGPQRR